MSFKLKLLSKKINEARNLNRLINLEPPLLVNREKLVSVETLYLRAKESNVSSFQHVIELLS